MLSIEFLLFILLTLLLAISLGVQIIVALGLTSFLGVWVFTGSFDIAMSLLSTASFDALRDYVFAVVPLFILMGELISSSGAASDLYRVMNRLFYRIPGRLAVATVAGNAVFAAAVGVSIASAAAFTRIAYPEMVERHYDRSVALGCIAGSSCLGMLIPPSVLLIIYGVLTEVSIGQLFVAGVGPGLVLTGLFAVYIIGLAMVRPALFGADGLRRGTRENQLIASPSDQDPPLRKSELLGGLGTVIVILLVLGGIWLGWFTPTEAAGVGALLGLALAVAKGLRFRQIVAAILETGRTSGPLLFLLLFAQMYSRLLSLAGAVDFIQELITGLNVSPAVTVSLMVLIWFVLGMFIDSASILLLSVPIFTPIAMGLGYDPLQFAIITVLAIEAGILTPPLGLAVYTVKAALSDDSVSMATIFRGSTPYWILILVTIVIIYLWPGVASYLPSLM